MIPFHDFAVFARMLLRVGAKFEIVAEDSRDQPFHILGHAIDGFHHLNERRHQRVILGTAANLLQFCQVVRIIPGRHVLRDSDGASEAFQSGVDALRQFPEDSRIDTRYVGSVVVDRHEVDDLVGLNQSAHGIDAVIEIIFEGLEITLAVVCDSGRHLAFAEAFSKSGGSLQGRHQLVQYAVDGPENGAVRAREEFRLGAFVELSLLNGVAQSGHFVGQLHVARHSSIYQSGNSGSVAPRLSPTASVDGGFGLPRVSVAVSGNGGSVLLHVSVAVSGDSSAVLPDGPAAVSRFASGFCHDRSLSLLSKVQSTQAWAGRAAAAAISTACSVSSNSSNRSFNL